MQVNARSERTKMIPINAPQIDDEEVEATAKVLRSGVLTTRFGDGPMVRRFEEEFASFIGAKHAIAMNNGTASLHAALLAAGVGPGDEVIVPSFTFVATAEAVVLTGAKPVFVDIGPSTYLIDPDGVRKAVTDRTKAVMPVDLYGLPADLRAIREIADEHGLIVVEDAAQAHGALYEGNPPGRFAHMAAWSYYASKNMTTGEGGMVTTDDDELADRLKCIRSHGEKEGYVSVMLGHNYRMPEIEAAIGLVQLRKLPKFLEVRRRNAIRLTKRLVEGGVEGKLALPFEPDGLRHGWYLYTVRMKGADVSDRDKLVEGLNERGIGSAVYYRTPIHLMPFYRRFGHFKLPETEKASQQVLSLPICPSVTDEQVDYIADMTLKLLNDKV